MALPARIYRPEVPRMGSKREDNEKHLDVIRRLHSCISGTPGPGDPHHLLRADNLPKGTGRTNEDRYAIPLTRAEHDALHDDKAGDEEAWLMTRQVDGRALAAALWACRDQGFEAYERVMFRHLQKIGKL